MKKTQITFLIAALVLILGSCKISNAPTAKYRKAPDLDFVPNYAYFAQPTQMKDTLFLLENDKMAKITSGAWDSVPQEKRPVIIFVPEKDMICIKNRCNGKSN